MNARAFPPSGHGGQIAEAEALRNADAAVSVGPAPQAPGADQCSHGPISSGATIAAEIAARYGATLQPGVTVKVIPRGESGIPIPVWDEATRTWSNSVSMKERLAKTKKVMWRASEKNRRYLQQRAREAQERRDAVVAMANEGRTVPQIVEATGLSDHTVWKYLREVGIKPIRPVIQRQRTGPTPETLARVDRIRGFAAQGYHKAKIARIEGIAEKTLAYICTKFGIEIGRKAPRVQAQPNSRRSKNKALIEQIKALIADGKTRAEICATTGASQRQLGVLNSRHNLGMVPLRVRLKKPKPAPKPKPTPRMSRAEIMARAEANKARIIAMRKQGKTREEISEALGISKSTLNRHIAGLGELAAKPKVEPARPRASRAKAEPWAELMALRRDRHDRLRAALASGEKLTVRELAARVCAGVSTVYADLKEIRADGGA